MQRCNYFCSNLIVHLLSFELISQGFSGASRTSPDGSRISSSNPSFSFQGPVRMSFIWLFYQGFQKTCQKRTFHFHLQNLHSTSDDLRQPFPRYPGLKPFIHLWHYTLLSMLSNQSMRPWWLDLHTNNPTGSFLFKYPGLISRFSIYTPSHRFLH